MSSVHDLRALAQSQYVLWPLSVHVTDRSHVGWLDSEKGMQGCALNSHHLKDYEENITTFFLMPSEFLKNRLHFSFSLLAHAFHIYAFVFPGGSFSFSQQRKIYALVFPLRGCSFFIIQMRWQSHLPSWRCYFWHLSTSCSHLDWLLFAAHLSSCDFILFISGFSFHSSLDFLDPFSIFLGFLFHFAEVYSQFYCCFAETILCRNVSVLICTWSERIIEMHFSSKGKDWCESDYRPIEDNTFLLFKLLGFSLHLCWSGRSLGC